MCRAGLPVIEGYFPARSGSLYFREVGDGLSMVVLHGGPDFNHRYLLPELDRFAAAFRLIYYDQRGRGRSAAGVVPAEVTIDSEMDDLDALGRNFSRDTTILLGHSWGCVLAMEYATRHADRVSHLVLLNPAPASHADLLHFRAHRQAAEAEVLVKMQAIAGTAGYASGDIATEAAYYRLHFGSTLRRHDLLEQIIGRLRRDFTPQGILQARIIESNLYGQTWLSRDYDLLARLKEVEVPTLVVRGEHDLIPLTCAANIVAAAPRGRLAVLERCGHFSYLERPAEVFDLVLRFVSEG